MTKNAATPVPHIPDAILPVQGGGYMVASRSTHGAWWLVWGSTCSCPATVKRCHHIRQVEAYCKGLDNQRKRPVAPVNVGLMVD